jgi:hypothetical protein
MITEKMKYGFILKLLWKKDSKAFLRHMACTY